MAKIKSLLTVRNIIIAVIVVLVLVWRINAYKNRFLKVDTTIAQRGKLTETISGSGEVNADKNATLAFPTSGKISWIKVANGDLVKRGQGLAAIDQTTLDAAYQQAQNMVRKYSATVDNIHDQVKDNSSDESFAQRDLRTSAEATNDFYYNNLRIAEYNLKNAVLVAPFAGIATNLASGVTVGAAVSITPILNVVDPTTTYFDAEIGELDISKIKVDQKVTLTLDAFPDDKYNQTVKSIGFSPVTTSTGGVAYKVRVALPENVNYKYKLGMNGDAEFITNEKDNVLLVPATALVENDNGNFVWLIVNNKAKKVPVTVGASSVDQFEIISGINEGDRVISLPPNTLKEGTSVKSN